MTGKSSIRAHFCEYVKLIEHCVARTRDAHNVTSVCAVAYPSDSMLQARGLYRTSGAVNSIENVEMLAVVYNDDSVSGHPNLNAENIDSVCHHSRHHDRPCNAT